MSSAPASGLICSMCRKTLPWGSKIVKCSVSTCNSGRIKLVFCSANCWDAHLPNARHRDAWFVDDIAARE